MQLSDILTPQRVVGHAQATSKKRALELLSQLLCNEQDLAQLEVFEGLINRERLGTTALGHGVALPHGRLKKLQQTVGAFVQFSQGVDFDAADRQPVDLLFGVAVPEKSTEEHLQLVAQIAEMFSDAAMRNRLRLAKDASELFHLLAEWTPQHLP